MVKQTWRGIERVTKNLYNLQPVPMLKDFLLTSMAGDSVLQSLMHNSTSTALPNLIKKHREGKLSAHEEIDSSNGRDEISSSKNSEALSPHSELTSSATSPVVARREKPSSFDHSRAPSASKESSKRASANYGNGAAGQRASRASDSTSPRGSRTDSTSSSESGYSYANTPDFRSSVLRLLGEDEDFRHSVITSLVSMGAVAPGAGVVRESGALQKRTSPKRRKATASEFQRIAVLEAEIERLRKLVPSLSDSSSE